MVLILSCVVHWVGCCTLSKKHNSCPDSGKDFTRTLNVKRYFFLFQLKSFYPVFPSSINYVSKLSFYSFLFSYSWRNFTR